MNKFITLSHLRRVVSAITNRFKSIENTVEDIEETKADISYVDDKGFADLSDVFVITCSDNNLAQHVMDKTWSEIVSAYGSGKSIYCHMDVEITPYGGTYPLSYLQTSVTGEFESQGYALFALDGVKIIIWDTTFNGNSHETWEYEYTNDTYCIWVDYDSGAYHVWGHSAQSIQDRIFKGTLVVLFYGDRYYYYCGYNNMDILELYFSNYDGTTLRKFTVRDLDNTTTVIFSSQQTRPDWNEEDSSASDYIKNKPLYLGQFYTQRVCNNKSFTTTLVDEDSYQCNLSSNNYFSELLHGGTAEIILNGATYTGDVVIDPFENYGFVSFSDFSVTITPQGVVFNSLDSMSGTITLNLPGKTVDVDPNYAEFFTSIGDNTSSRIPVAFNWNNIDNGQVLGLANNGWTNMDIPQSDWNENTSTNPSYVANRTHYKTSGGYVFSFDEKLLSKISFYDASYDTNTDINKTYAKAAGMSFKTLVDNFNNYFPTNSLNDIDSSAESITVTIDNTDMVLSKLYVSDNSYFGTSTLYYYNNDFCLAFFVYGDLYIQIYANSLSFETINFDIPLTNEVFEYHHLNNNYLNGDLIHKGQGYKSEIYNGTNKYAGDYAHAEGYDEDVSGDSFVFIINGEANSKSYNFTTTQDLYKLMYDRVAIGLKLKVYDDNNYNSYHEATITNFYFNENEKTGIINVDQTLNSENPIVDHAAYIESFYGIVAFGTGSHAEGSGTFASGNYAHAEGEKTMANGENAHAEGYQTTASGYRAHAEGYFTFANGENAHAEGYNAKASGQDAHAEGSQTIASGGRSHAEGWGAKASGSSSHAEGYQTKASGNYAHAEGNGSFSSRAPLSLTGDANATTYTTYYNMHSIGLNHPKFLLGATLYSDTSIYITSIGYTDFTVNSITLSKTLDSENAISSKTYYFDYDIAAKGESSHVEGTVNTAAGEGSHAEGYYNMGYAKYSHVEGRNTIASSDYQHVQGKYNIEDSSGTYAHIVGNGTASSRSNAHTLDWNGNGWYAGKVSAGTIASPASVTNTNDLTTKAYVDTAVMGFNTHIGLLAGTAISSPSNGQVLSYDSINKKWVNADVSHPKSDWNETTTTNASYIDNKPAIKSGTGKNSIITGETEDDEAAATYTLYLTGAAGSRTYSYTTQDTLPNVTLFKLRSYAEILTNDNLTYRGLIEDIDYTNLSVTFSMSLDSINALSNKEVSVYFKYGSIAGKDGGFAEGCRTKAFGAYAHSEGYNTLSNGHSSHSEGYVTAAANYAHSEGQYTYAIGYTSHSEGKHTIAGSPYQHVQGTYNIEDNDGVYAHIVGNGAEGIRSNAHTLDWSGNSWYAGKVSAGTVASPASVTNANDLTTKAYVDNALSGVTTNLAGLTDTTVSSPSNGQILIYNSTTSKWENATSPYQTQAQVNALIAAALAEYGDGDTATYGYADGNEVNY